MITVPAVLITVAGPGGHVDIGVRSDASIAELAASLAAVLGIGRPWPGAEHRAPPRPGEPGGRRAHLRPETSLADAGVADGDLVIFGRQPSDHTAGAGTQTAAADRGPTAAAAERRPAEEITRRPPAERSPVINPAGGRLDDD